MQLILSCHCNNLGLCDQENIHATNLGLISRIQRRKLGLKWELMRSREGAFFPNLLFFNGPYCTGVFLELRVNKQ